MELLKDWTACVCITLIVGTIFSLIMPNGRMTSFYKIVISLFVFLSFVYPLKDANIYAKDFNINTNKISVDDNNKALSNMLEAKIKAVLLEENIKNASVIVKSSKNIDEIEIQSVSVAVTNDYELKNVQRIIFDKLGINAEVHYIGD